MRNPCEDTVPENSHLAKHGGVGHQKVSTICQDGKYQARGESSVHVQSQSHAWGGKLFDNRESPLC